MTLDDVMAELTTLAAALEARGDETAARYVKLAALKLEMAQLLLEPVDPTEGDR